MSDLRDSIMETAVTSGFSGVVRVDEGSEVLIEEAFGLAHRGFEVPNDPGTQFATASGGKGFTALAVVSLIEDGVLNLETTARSWLGDDLPLIAGDVTVEHLLAHTSGIGDYLDEEEGGDLTEYVLVSPIHELENTEAFLRELDGYPTKFQAGERFSYCNAGYVVLAIIAERASGTPYHELVQERVLNPARLESTGFFRSDMPSGRMATGYMLEEGLWANLLHLPVRGNGDGGIYTTAADMKQFWGALFDGDIVGQNWVKEVTAPRSDPPGEDAGYGLGFWVARESGGVSLIGGDAGVSFSSMHDADAQVTWTVLSNSTEGAWPVVRLLKADLGG